MDFRTKQNSFWFQDKHKHWNNNNMAAKTSPEMTTSLQFPNLKPTLNNLLILTLTTTPLHSNPSPPYSLPRHPLPPTPRIFHLCNMQTTSSIYSKPYTKTPPPLLPSSQPQEYLTSAICKPFSPYILNPTLKPHPSSPLPNPKNISPLQYPNPPPYTLNPVLNHSPPKNISPQQYANGLR